MKRLIRLSATPVGALLLLAAGHGAAAPSSPTPEPVIPAASSEAPVPKEAVCAVCGVREQAGPEPVAATFVYQGKTYAFCKQACKEEFRLDPEKWIKAAATPPASRSPMPAARPDATAVPT
jgi:YHS domain-containing protein